MPDSHHLGMRFWRWNGAEGICKRLRASILSLFFVLISLPGIKTNHYGFSIILDENQVTALEKAKEEKQAHREIGTYYPGFLVSQDTYYVEHIKRVGHIYQQTVIDTYSKIGFAELYDRKKCTCRCRYA